MIRLLHSSDGYTVKPDPELLVIRVVDDLIKDRDNEDLVTKELGYIYFQYNLVSDFNSQKDMVLRSEDVRDYVGLPPDWIVDNKLQRVIDIYVESQENEISYSLLKTSYNMVDKIKDQLDNIDLNERDKSGKPMWNIKIIKDTVGGLYELTESLKKVENEFIKSQQKNMSGRSGTLYDNIKLGRK